MTDFPWRVGQEVVLTYDRGSEAIVKIDKIDRGRAFVGARRFREDGSEIKDRGDNSWFRASIAPATEQDKARIIGERRRASNVAYLRGVDWSAQPDDVLQRVLAVFGRTL